MWRPAPPSATARAAREAAEADRSARPERYRLDVDAVAAAAARRAGDEDRFAAGWREGLERYLGSAAGDGRLTALGTAQAIRTAIGRLRSGAAMARFAEVEPDRVARPIAPPIFITGGWRTGTTFLFRLLATDPRLRAPLPAELSDPARLAGLEGVQREAHLDTSAAAHDALYDLNPELRAIHDSGGRLPEECALALGTDLRNWAFPSTMRLDGYARWLADEDLTPSCRAYRRALGALDRGDDRRWVLKAPTHLAALPALADAFPGAVVVRLHRDIVETVASGASLFAVFRSSFSDEVDAVEVGRYLVDQTELWYRRAAAFRADPTAATVTIVDLEYRDLVDDPATTIREVYAAADLDPPPDPAAFVADYHAGHPRDAHGTHRYTADDFGLDPGEIRERFAPYTA